MVVRLSLCHCHDRNIHINPLPFYLQQTDTASLAMFRLLRLPRTSLALAITLHRQRAVQGQGKQPADQSVRQYYAGAFLIGGACRLMGSFWPFKPQTSLLPQPSLNGSGSPH